MFLHEMFASNEHFIRKDELRWIRIPLLDLPPWFIDLGWLDESYSSVADRIHCGSFVDRYVVLHV